MAAIYLQNITTPHRLKDVNLTIGDGDLMVLLGPSGAGKSTLLNVVAGLTEYQGEVYFDRKNVNQVPTEKRGIGYLLQDIYLFPHMDVFSNVAFGLRAAAMPADAVTGRVGAILDLLNIAHLKNRYPKELSGGEKQRVGLARSLAKEPHILLLDEPLASLDPFTAKKLRKELKALL
ncbi:MAG: ATP-binding cassette domain-containing protein, partial [Firmicutes bacterium]|nr:ATP-binding cassette domain-containing protein [Bacillota bacterium]